jgi:hypothetical protein
MAQTGGQTGGGGYGGGIRPFYAVIIRDKCKTANPDTLRAYKTVAQDLLHDQDSGYANNQDLKDAIKELDDAISGQGKK